MLRSRFLSSFPFVAGVAAALQACAVTPPSDSSPGPQTTVQNGGGDAATDASVAAPEAAADASGGQALGSRLCLQSVTSQCDPDAPSACGLDLDGGTYDPDAASPDAPVACRVVPSGSASSNGLGNQPACATAGAGMDGASCTSGSDCAAGFDCVAGGVCRHYCCAGNAPCGTDQFCDIQPLAQATTTRIPVCMPVEACSLTVAGSCGDASTHRTCAVVRDNGTTSCVETGNAKAGESCDTEHCQAGLVCLGPAGLRQCFTLCMTGTVSSCMAPDSCQGGLPLFQDPTVGVCKP